MDETAPRPASPEIAPLSSHMFADSNADSGDVSGEHRATGPQTDDGSALPAMDPEMTQPLPPGPVTVPPHRHSDYPSQQRHDAARLSADDRLLLLAANFQSEGQSYIAPRPPVQQPHSMAPMVPPLQATQPVQMVQRQHNVQLVQPTAPREPAISQLRTSALGNEDTKVVKRKYNTKAMRARAQAEIDAGVKKASASGYVPQQHYQQYGSGQVAPSACFASRRATSACRTVCCLVGFGPIRRICRVRCKL